MSQNDIIHNIAYFMNHAEEYVQAQDKKAYVVEQVLEIFPDADPDFVDASIEIFISFSKTSIPLLVNQAPGWCTCLRRCRKPKKI